MSKDEVEDLPLRVTDIDALAENTQAAVMAFADRWISMPSFSERCEVMDQRQLRDTMGLRATAEAGDPWPTAEKLLIELGFRWHWLGTSRVMYLQEKSDWQDTGGWEEAEELKD